MKRINGIILTLALLMAGTLGAWAQYSDKISSGDSEMLYAFGGGEVASDVQKKSTPNEVHHSIACRIGPGGTIALSGKKLKGPDSLKIIVIQVRFKKKDGSLAAPVRREIFKNGSGSLKLQVPEGTEEVSASITFKARRSNRTVIGGYSGKDLICFVSWYVRAGAPTTIVPGPSTTQQAIDNCNCDYIKDDIGYNLIDSHIRFNDFYGEVKMRPNWMEDDSYEFVDLDSPIYECYRIKTEEDSGAILGLWDMSTYVMKPESILIIRTEEDNQSKIQMIMGNMWANIKKMAEGKSVVFEMSECVCGINGTIVALEEKNGESNVYLFAGKVDVTSKKTKKKQVLQPGQTTSVGKDGKIVVKKFNIEQGAKKFGIPMSEIRNHYSNTTTTATTKRYDVERAMVKYKVTTGTTQGVMAKVFDKYGQKERRELKMGNQTTLQLTQGNNSYSLDTQAKTYTQVTNAELNFLNMNDPVMLKLKLKKKGTAKVLNRECTIYANSDTEFYVWKGIVLKKVAHTKKGITTTEATSVELPASVDSKYFNMPAGYRKK
jgi:hypothetical protein